MIQMRSGPRGRRARSGKDFATGQIPVTELLESVYAGASGVLKPAPLSDKPRPLRWSLNNAGVKIVLSVLALLALAASGLAVASHWLGTVSVPVVGVEVPPRQPKLETAAGDTSLPSQSRTALVTSIDADANSPTNNATLPAAKATADTEYLAVHITGAVNNPGLQELPARSRIADALEKAGGLSPGAAVDQINLARELRDGQQIFVPGSGQTPPPACQQASITAGICEPANAQAEPHPPGSRSVNALGPAGGLIAINSASAEALQQLPGIGPALADRIVQHRAKHGPFANIGQLTEVSGIGPRLLSRLKDLVRL